MKARIAVAVFALSAVPATILLVRCGGDAGAPDAGAPDAGPDRVQHPDAGADAGDDGACSVTSDWPGFRRLTEFDPCAPADVLVDPDAGFNVSWTDCGDAGVSGCKELVHPSPKGIYAYATHDGTGSGKALFLEGLDNTSTVEQFDVFDLSTSSRLGEWRIDVVASNGAMIVLANTSDFTTAFLGWRFSSMLAAMAPTPALFAGNPMALKPYPAPGQDINWAVSEQVMAFQPYAAPYTICQVAAATCVALDVTSIAPAVPYYMFAWHDVVFAAAFHGTTGWGQEYVVHADGSITLLRANSNAHIWGMVTDGTTLVWNETYGTTDLNGAQTTSEIWNAPFTTSQATLTATATKVVTLPVAALGLGPAQTVFFNGIYASYLKPPVDGIYAVAIPSGQTQTVPKGPGGLVGGIPYVDKNEVWQVTTGLSSQYSLVRVPFAHPWQ